MSAFVLPKDFLGYEAGTELRDVTLEEARSMECNRCGLSAIAAVGFVTV